jgi:hypothetical protein
MQTYDYLKIYCSNFNLTCLQQKPKRRLERKYLDLHQCQKHGTKYTWSKGHFLFWLRNREICPSLNSIEPVLKDSGWSIAGYITRSGWRCLIGSIFLWKYLPATCLAFNKLRCESLFFCHNGLYSIKFLLRAVHFANHCVRSPVANQCLEIPGSSASNVVAVISLLQLPLQMLLSRDIW